MDKLNKMGVINALKAYIAQNRPFMGICVGLQCLFESSLEAPNVSGLGIIQGKISKFKSDGKSVPHIGWNYSIPTTESLMVNPKSRYYFVHSFAAMVDSNVQEEMQSTNVGNWIHSLTTYGDETFVSSVKFGNVFATQFHPEKSGWDGLQVIDAFLKETPQIPLPRNVALSKPADGLSKRIIACLDVRTNDQGLLN